ncbi:MAG: T9SS type A sorting domain-containing protein [Bacteroidales bacterium]|nr:T9SS type A sorting domain-containing protein [Bacteroidales bacterium]
MKRGEWEYELLWNIDTTGVEFGPEPEYPSYPYLQDFMTEEEIAAYDAAYEAWQTEYYGIYNTQPILSDFMTEEELQEAIDYWTDLWGYDCSWVIEYNYYVQSFCTEEEYAAYENAYDDWLIELEAVGTSPQLASYATEEEIAAQEAAMEVYYEEVDKYYEWQTVYYELISSVPQFEFNDIYMSANGKYAVTNSRKEDWYSAEVECTTYKFNLEDGTYETLPVGDFLASFVDNNGTVYAGKGASYTYSEAYVCQNDEWVPFTDTIVNTHPETYAWMIENMTQTYTDYVYDGWSWSEVEVTSVLSGSPCGSADMSVFASWTATPWDWTIGYESYIIPLGVYTSIADAVVAEGDVTTEYYDLQGRRVANTNNLKNGIYIVRTIDANGKATAKAVKF